MPNKQETSTVENDSSRLLTVQGMGSIAQEAGEKRKEEIKEEMSKVFGGVKEKMDGFVTKLLGMPEAISSQKEAIENYAVSTWLRTETRIVDAYDSFTDKVAQTKEDIVEGFKRKRDEVFEKAEDLGRGSLKLALRPVVSVADRIKEIYTSIPESLANMKLERAKEKRELLKFRKGQTKEYYDDLLIRIQEEKEQALNEISIASRETREKIKHCKEEAMIWSQARRDSSKIRDFVESL